MGVLSNAMNFRFILYTGAILFYLFVLITIRRISFHIQKSRMDSSKKEFLRFVISKQYFHMKDDRT